MAIRINTAFRNRQADHAASAFDEDAGSFATFEGYSGSGPASANDAPTGTKLYEIELPADPFAAAVAGIAQQSEEWEGVGLDDGTCGWGRLTSADGTLKADLRAGVDFTMDDYDVANTAPVTVVGASVTQGSGEP